MPGFPGMPGMLGLPGMGMPGMRGTQAPSAADCERIEQSFRGGAMPGGMDTRAIIAAMGCRPPDAPVREKTATKTDCANLRQSLTNFEYGDWLGPGPVMDARIFSAACREFAVSAAERRALAGWLSFGEGRFQESADTFRDAASQAPSEAARVRYTLESAKSLLAAGRTADALAVFENVLAQLPAAATEREPRRRAFGVPNMADMQAESQREDQRRGYVAQRIEVLVLLGIAHLNANDAAAAVVRLREAEAVTQARAKAQGGGEMTQPFDDRYGAPTLAIALQRMGQADEARKIFERLVGGRETAIESMEQLQTSLPMMQRTLSQLGLGGILDSSEMNRGMNNADSAKLMLGEIFGLGLACSLLEEIHVSASRADAALEVAERCRGRALARTLANRAFKRSEPAALPSSAEINAYARQHRIDYTAAGKILTDERTNNRDAQAASRPATIGEIRRIAAERRATLVVYSIVYAPNRLPSRMPDNETGMTIWVVSPDGAVAVRRRTFEGILPDGTLALTSAALRAHEALGLSGRGPTSAGKVSDAQAKRTSAELRRFYQILIEPVADLLPAQEGARIVFVPQGPLFLIPFAALEDAQGAPLVARYSISLAPSLQTLALTGARKAESRSAGAPLIVGNPLMPRYSPVPGKPPLDIPPLPGAEQEAKAIATLLETSFLTGAAATKAAVLSRARDARYVHLATHGFLDDFADSAQQGANPHFREMPSEERAGGGFKTPGMLALAPSGADNGMLTADEIAAATTGADLVVMSACGSGQGVINDEGVIGLSRAWMAAGAPSVVVSLWPIPDEPTRDLMVEFYRRLSGGSGKAEALRTAMLATRAKHPNPVSWAAFVLLGEPD